jgi:hypothetical protein
MRASSFRWVVRRLVPRGDRCKRAALCAVLAAAGCGGEAEKEVTQHVVRGAGYTFEAPAGWTIVRSGRQVQAAAGGKSLALVAVTRFPLTKRFRPERWDAVVKELDRVATVIAAQQHGSVSSSSTTTLAAQPARRYDIAYESRGKQLVERVAFLFRGKREYLLLCRFEQAGDAEPCDRLLRSFRLT